MLTLTNQQMYQCDDHKKMHKPTLAVGENWTPALNLVYFR